MLQIQYSPVAALNRTYALSKARSTNEAIIEAEKLQLSNNHYYYSLLGELYKDVNINQSKMNFTKAKELAKTNTDKKFLQKKIDALVC